MASNSRSTGILHSSSSRMHSLGALRPPTRRRPRHSQTGLAQGSLGSRGRHKQAAEAVEGIGREWHTVEEATRLLPHSPGMFKLGFGHKSGVDVIFICHTTEHRTLNDMVIQILYGFEGGTRLEMMVVDPENRKKLMVQWTASSYPEDLIEDEIEEHIATHHQVPEYNIPVDDSKGIWTIIDEDDHESNTIAPTY